MEKLKTYLMNCLTNIFRPFKRKHLVTYNVFYITGQQYTVTTLMDNKEMKELDHRAVDRDDIQLVSIVEYSWLKFKTKNDRMKL